MPYIRSIVSGQRPHTGSFEKTRQGRRPNRGRMHLCKGWSIHGPSLPETHQTKKALTAIVRALFYEKTAPVLGRFMTYCALMYSLSVLTSIFACCASESAK